MLTYKEALEIAKKLKPNIDKCYEFDCAYMFASKDDEYTIGGDGPCIVLKETGGTVAQTIFYDDYYSEPIREFNL